MKEWPSKINYPDKDTFYELKLVLMTQWESPNQEEFPSKAHKARF